MRESWQTEEQAERRRSLLALSQALLPSLSAYARARAAALLCSCVAPAQVATRCLASEGHLTRTGRVELAGRSLRHWRARTPVWLQLECGGCGESRCGEATVACRAVEEAEDWGARVTLRSRIARGMVH